MITFVFHLKLCIINIISCKRFLICSQQKTKIAATYLRNLFVNYQRLSVMRYIKIFSIFARARNCGIKFNDRFKDN